MDSVRRSTRKRKCVDYNDESLKSPNSDTSPSRMSAQKTLRNGENIASPQIRKKKKLSLGKKSGTSNKDNEEKVDEKSLKYEEAQEVNMVVVVDPTPTNIKYDAKDDELFDDGELSDPPKDLDDDLESEVKPQDKPTKKTKSISDLDDDVFVFDCTDDESDYEEGRKSKSNKKSPNAGRKAKSTPAKENDDIKKGKGKKQSVSTTNTSAASPLQAKKAPGGLKRKPIGELNPLTPKFTKFTYDSKSSLGLLNKIPSSGLSRKLKVKPLHPYLKKK